MATGVRIDGTDAVLGDHWSRPPRECPSAELELGIRPGFVRRRAAHRRGRRCRPRSTRVEDLGNYKLVTAGSGRTRVKAKLDEDARGARRDGPSRLRRRADPALCRRPAGRLTGPA